MKTSVRIGYRIYRRWRQPDSIQVIINRGVFHYLAIPLFLFSNLRVGLLLIRVERDTLLKNKD